MTKGQIDRLGEQIRKEHNIISEETIAELQRYRISHKSSLSQVFNVLCKLNKNRNKNIVTYRIKRFESIIGKLYRYPSMKFSRMWDIGGCRCIVQNNDDVYRLKALIESSPELEIRKEYDYIKTPQSEGYKSLHLFVSIKGDSTVIELQIRNRDDHNWATLVEISDLLFDAKLKEYGENKELLRFHYLLSKRDGLCIEDKIEIAKIIKQHEYIERLSDVFARNYLQVRKQWLEIETKHKFNYFLIETKKDEIPKINAFKSFEEAENEYFNIYKNSHNANVVLTHLTLPSYEQISIAYSNYILTFHSILDDCYDIMESLIEKTLMGKQYLDYLKYFKQYNVISYNHIRNVVNEISEVSSIALKNKSKGSGNRKRNKEKEWINDIDKRIKYRRDKQKALGLLYRKHMPTSFLGRQFIIRASRYITSKFERKLKRLVRIN